MEFLHPNSKNLRVNELIPLTKRPLRGNLPAMRIVFMGTGDIALPSLQRLLNKSNVVAVVTQPDRPVGRHQRLMAPALKVMAEDYGILVLQPESLRTPESIQAIRELTPDLIIVMAYGQILPEAILTMPPMGCINVHASLLPKHRGASCIAAAIREGDTSIGVTVMHMAQKLDSGDLIKSVSLPLMGKETCGMMHTVLSNLAPDVLMDVIHAIESGTAIRIPQDESQATYAPKLVRGNGRINWSLSAIEIERMMRAYDPWPGTYTYFKDRKGRNRSLKLFPCAKVKKDLRSAIPGSILSISEHGLLVACGENSLLIPSVQPDGGKKMTVAQFAAGRPLEIGSILDPAE